MIASLPYSYEPNFPIDISQEGMFRSVCGNDSTNFFHTILQIQKATTCGAAALSVLPGSGRLGFRISVNTDLSR